MSIDLKAALLEHQQMFGLEISSRHLDRLEAFYQLVEEHSSLLHLVAPCTAGEFATRHVLESLTLLKYLPQNAKFADVGAGAGLPSIPCLLARDDLRAVLIESSVKKSIFLTDAIQKLDLGSRVTVIDRQFAETTPENADFITCRALDKFVDRIPALLRWANGTPILFFGGPTLAAALDKVGLDYRQELLPLSERRFLFEAGARRGKREE